MAPVRAGADWPEPRLAGVGRWVCAFSSSASRTTVAKDTPRERASSRSLTTVVSSAMMVVRCMASLCTTRISAPTPRRQDPAKTGAFRPEPRALVQYHDHMTIKVTATEAKARILGLLDEVESGEEVEITRHGRTVARLVPATGPHALEGMMSGVALTGADDDGLFTTGATWDLP